MLGPREPIMQNREKATSSNFWGRIQIFRKRAYGALVDLEEQTILAAEVLEDRALRDSKTRRDIAYTSRVITVLGEMLHSSFDNAAALGVGARTRRGNSMVKRRRCSITGDS